MITLLFSSSFLPIPCVEPSFKYSQPQTENRKENNIYLFTGSIMDPLKTGPSGLFATALVSLGKSGLFYLVWYQNRLQLQTGQFPLARRASSRWPRFHRLRDGQKLPKIVYGESVFKKCENKNDWLDYWSGRRKKNNNKKLKKKLKEKSLKKNCRLDYWSGHGRTNRTVCYGPVLLEPSLDSDSETRLPAVAIFTTLHGVT